MGGYYMGREVREGGVKVEYNRRMKVLITGAHFTPAQAVIEELKKAAGVEVVYLGRAHTREGDRTPSAESQILPSLGVKFIPITAGRLQRSFTFYTIPSLLKIPIGFLQSLYLLLREKPDVVLSFGGYIGVPVVFSAWLLSIPIIIHEQTLVAGLANTISSWFADKVAVTFKEGQFKGGKVILTGNPLRRELVDADEKEISPDIRQIIGVAKKESLPLVLIVGGNQGSHKVNESVGEVLERLTESVCIVHQTGDSKFGDFEKLREEGGKLKNSQRYLVREWIHEADLGVLLKKIKLFVSRGGMNFLLEAGYFAKPILIIPLPVQEQERNARYFQELGNARVLWQKELSGENLLKAVKDGLGNLKSLEERAKKVKEMVTPDAAQRLAWETLILANRDAS